MIPMVQLGCPRSVRGFVDAAFARRNARGTTLVEAMVVLTILVVAAGIFSRIVIATSHLRDVTRENSVAAEAARKILEQMRNEEFGELFKLYNPDPTDDPNGPGSAPGNLFEVSGLEALADSIAGKQLEIILPAFPPATPSKLVGTKWEVQAAQSLLGALLGGGGGAQGAEGGGGEGGEAAVPTWELREDYQDERLGLPRDLNGDSILDSLDHSEDYILLPILVRIKWEGRHGPRVYEVFSMLAEFKRSS